MRVKRTAIVSTVAVSAAIVTNESGFMPGSVAVCHFSNSGAALFAGSAIMQTSADNVNWATAVDSDTNLAMVAMTGADRYRNVILSGFARLNVTAVTAGALGVVLYGTTA